MKSTNAAFICVIPGHGWAVGDFRMLTGHELERWKEAQRPAGSTESFTVRKPHSQVEPGLCST